MSENHIFEPDTVLASQFFDAKAGPHEPERALMLAVLEEAARCFLSHGNATDHRQRALYEDSRAWFFSSERSYLYDFENVCDVLGLDAGYMRSCMRFAHAHRRARTTATALAPL